MEQPLTLAEAADHLGVSTRTIRRMIQRGEVGGDIQPTPQGYKWLVLLDPDQPLPAVAQRPRSATPAYLQRVGDSNGKASATHRNGATTHGAVEESSFGTVTTALLEQLAVKDRQIEHLHEQNRLLADQTRSLADLMGTFQQRTLALEAPRPRRRRFLWLF